MTCILAQAQIFICLLLLRVPLLAPVERCLFLILSLPEICYHLMATQINAITHSGLLEQTQTLKRKRFLMLHLDF